MKRAALIAASLVLLPISAQAGEVVHNPVAMPPGMTMPGGASPPFSGSVMAGKTLYVSGTTDGAVAGDTPEMSAKRVLDNIKRTVEGGGLTMDDLVLVQVFCSDLANYQAFNTVYRTYFKGPMPARAFLGVDHLLGGARFEVMGIAVTK